MYGNRNEIRYVQTAHYTLLSTIFQHTVMYFVYSLPHSFRLVEVGHMKQSSHMVTSCCYAETAL